MHCYRDGGPHIPIAWSRSFKISTTRLQGATVMTKPIDDPIVSGRRLGGKARFLALLRYGAWLEGRHRRASDGNHHAPPRAIAAGARRHDRGARDIPDRTVSGLTTLLSRHC